MDIGGQIAEPVRVTAVFIVIPAEDLGVDNGYPHGRLRQGLEKCLRQVGDMREIDIDECRPAVVELPFDHDRRIHSDQIGRDILLFRKDDEVLRILLRGPPIDVIEHLCGSGESLLPFLFP